MGNKDSEFFNAINEATAARREVAEMKKREKASIEYIKAVQKELRKEKARDRLYMAAVIGCLMCGLFCSYRIGIIPLNLTVPAEVACFGLAFGCVVDAVRLFKGGKRK